MIAPSKQVYCGHVALPAEQRQFRRDMQLWPVPAWASFEAESLLSVTRSPS
jgi:hypothetical protein